MKLFIFCLIYIPINCSNNTTVMFPDKVKQNISIQELFIGSVAERNLTHYILTDRLRLVHERILALAPHVRRGCPRIVMAETERLERDRKSLVHILTNFKD